MNPNDGIRTKLSDYAPAAELGARLRLGVADAVAALADPDDLELAWDELGFRRRLLDGCGFSSADALALAVRFDVELRSAVELVRSGCEPATATRILL